MKSFINKITASVFFIFAVTSIVSAQEKTIHFTGSKFTYPIVEKWITEYKKEKQLSDIQFEINTEKSKDSDFQIIAHQPQPEELDSEHIVLYVGRYALIPVTNPNNPSLDELKKGISKKDLKDLIFEKSLDDLLDEPQKEKYNFTVYARDSKSSTAIALAEYFGQKPEQIKGKKIIGDDLFLLNAIKKDINGLTFNSLSYIYDINTRQLKQDISILPLKIKSQQQAILNSNDIDKTLSLLEETAIETIPIEKFGFVVPAEYACNKDFIEFANWILENGQQYNHELGFLKLDNQSLALQKTQLKERNLSMK